MKSPRFFFAVLALLVLSNSLQFSLKAQSLDLIQQYVTFEPADGAFVVSAQGRTADICVDAGDWAGVLRAANALGSDIEKVTGIKPTVSNTLGKGKQIVVGTIGKSRFIDKLIKNKKLDVSGVKDAWESFVIATVDDYLVIAGSDKRGTIYGIYNLSENIGVSPWYYWADAPIAKHAALYVSPGRYVMPSPKVKYRGIFLNDEAPCLTSWVKNTFGTEYGGHDFYEKVFDLILRLRGNYLWPAMWGWAFYADDPENSKLADEMGIVMGTSHHEPMARNHQEWARNRNNYGAWDYNANQEVIDKFFTEGVQRIADKEDIITIGMRGDGDAPMGGKEGHDDEYQAIIDQNLRTLQRVIDNQRSIIEQATSRPASEHPQLWALYKEVQMYYDLGLKVPDDVIILLADDNWGNVRKLPSAADRKHPGGWGMYYHVDYVGAPRNTKWLNVTPIQGMWEQLLLTYEYGVDRLWILNVGDLKPMEYPITLFLDMAWDPTRFTVDNLMDHPQAFCSQLFGEPYGKEAAQILNLYSKYNGRVTPEMLDARTYNLHSGEWRAVRDDYLSLETRALRLQAQLPKECLDAYFQVILYPVQAMANLYDMYYSQAMNHKLYALNDPACNPWADRVKAAFDRDAMLQDYYNNVLADGKWRGMMTQKHIGYTSWNDNFPADRLPKVMYIDDTTPGGYVFSKGQGVTVIEAEHFYEAVDAPDASWTVIPDMGRTLSGVTLMPRLPDPTGAQISYRMHLPEDVDSAAVHVVLKSTLPFARPEGHRYLIAFDDLEPVEVNFNGHLNDQVGNPYAVFYPTVARRVIEMVTRLPIKDVEGEHVLTIKPLDPGAVFEKIVVDYGGYAPSYLFMDETTHHRAK